MRNNLRQPEPSNWIGSSSSPDNKTTLSMKSLSRVFILLLCFSCNNHSEKIKDHPKIDKKEGKLVVVANLVASYTNYSNPRDRNYYYLVDVKLINNTNKECEFYTLICGSLVNIITDSRQVSFLYHNCSVDLAVLIKLNPKQEYSVATILLRNKYMNAFNHNVRFGFIISKPKTGFGKNIPITNHEIVSDLKLMREKQENVIWSDPVVLSAINFNPYEIRNIINDSTYSMSTRN
jgi:hypothetical protein